MHWGSDYGLWDLSFSFIQGPLPNYKNTCPIVTETVCQFLTPWPLFPVLGQPGPLTGSGSSLGPLVSPEVRAEVGGVQAPVFLKRLRHKPRLLCCLEGSPGSLYPITGGITGGLANPPGYSPLSAHFLQPGLVPLRCT